MALQLPTEARCGAVSKSQAKCLGYWRYCISSKPIMFKSLLSILLFYFALEQSFPKEGLDKAIPVEFMKLIRALKETKHFKVSGTLAFDVYYGKVLGDGPVSPENGKDEIGVQDPDGIICGASVVGDDTMGLKKGEFFILAFGDDPKTPQDEGAEKGDRLKFRYWDSDRNKEYNLEPRDFLNPGQVTDVYWNGETLIPSEPFRFSLQIIAPKFIDLGKDSSLSGKIEARIRIPLLSFFGENLLPGMAQILDSPGQNQGTKALQNLDTGVVLLDLKKDLKIALLPVEIITEGQPGEKILNLGEDGSIHFILPESGRTEIIVFPGSYELNEVVNFLISAKIDEIVIYADRMEGKAGKERISFKFSLLIEKANSSHEKVEMDKEGRVWFFYSDGFKQQVYPSFHNGEEVRRKALTIDGIQGARIDLDGSLVVIFQGESYVLVPSFILKDFPFSVTPGFRVDTLGNISIVYSDGVEQRLHLKE